MLSQFAAQNAQSLMQQGDALITERVAAGKLTGDLSQRGVAAVCADQQPIDPIGDHVVGEKQ